MGMLPQDILGAATGVGLALFIALSAIICKYYSRNRKERMILYSPPRRPSQDRRQRKIMRMREAKAAMALPPQQQNFSIFREQPQRTHPSQQPYLSSSCPTPSAMPARPHAAQYHQQEHVYVRLSLPDVHVEDDKVPASQSSYSLPSVRKRSPVNRARSMDARAMPAPVPRLSICTRVESREGGPGSPSFLRTPSPESSIRSPDPASPMGGIRPRSLSPLLSPAYSQNSQSSRDSSDCGPSPGSASPLGSIQPDLYKKKDMVFFHQSTDSQDGTKYGRLHFRLKFDFDRSDLVVHVIEALDLGCLTLSEKGFNDPYVKVSLIPEVDTKQRRTDIRRNCSDPFFNEVFKFPVTYDELADKSLLFEVFDYDRFSRNDVTGEVRIQMCEVDITSEVEVWSEIQKSGRQVSLDRPEILLSLSFLPSAGRLTLVIMKAANLASLDTKDYPDVYVKVSLTSGDKKMKKKKTSTKKGDSNPVWNEALSFDVTEEDLKHYHLVVSVVNCHHGHSPLLGTCVLGHRGHGQGSEHWNNVVQTPRKAIAMWHPLYI